jgi:hypothetical protein
MNTSPTFQNAYAFFWALVKMLIGVALVSVLGLLFIGISLDDSGWLVAAFWLAPPGLLGMSIYAGIRAYRSVRHHGLRSRYPIVWISLAGIGLLGLMVFFFFLYHFQT